MATPEFQVQSGNAQINRVSPGSLRIRTFDTSGNPVDVSSGYSLVGFAALAQSNPNVDLGSIDLSGHVSTAFDTTGLTISWTQVQSAAINALLQTANNSLVAFISNDGGASQALVFNGSLNLTQPLGLL